MESKDVALAWIVLAILGIGGVIGFFVGNRYGRKSGTKIKPDPNAEFLALVLTYGGNLEARKYLVQAVKAAKDWFKRDKEVEESQLLSSEQELGRALDERNRAAITLDLTEKRVRNLRDAVSMRKKELAKISQEDAALMRLATDLGLKPEQEAKEEEGAPATNDPATA